MPATLLDTNVLLYAVSSAPEEAGKKHAARALMARGDWGVSIQVLQEFYVNVTRGTTPAMRHDQAGIAIREFLSRPVAVNDTALLLASLDIRERYRLSYWDAAVIAAAKTLGAATLYSEDLNHGQDYDGVRVLNPFLTP